MSKVIEFIRTLPAGFRSHKELDAAYMARAIDLCELERRMHRLELQARGFSPSYSLM